MSPVRDLIREKRPQIIYPKTWMDFCGAALENALFELKTYGWEDNWKIYLGGTYNKNVHKGYYNALINRLISYRKIDFCGDSIHEDDWYVYNKDTNTLFLGIGIE